MLNLHTYLICSLLICPLWNKPSLKFIFYTFMPPSRYLLRSACILGMTAVLPKRYAGACRGVTCNKHTFVRAFLSAPATIRAFAISGLVVRWRALCPIYTTYQYHEVFDSSMYHNSPTMSLVFTSALCWISTFTTSRLFVIAAWTSAVLSSWWNY